jgi:hypothetical protein
MHNEVGYEHYFINYFLYLPFSKKQEHIVISESVKILINAGILKYEDLDSFLLSVRNIFNKMKILSNQPLEELNKKLSLPNKKRLNLFFNDDLHIKQLFPNFVNEYLKLIKNEKFQFFEENDNGIKYIINGDYIYKNENVEIFLHQRTMKKVKYKKREYDNIHPVDSEMIKLIMENKEIFIN